MIRADIDRLLPGNDFQIMKVVLHYVRHGKSIYRILKDQCFITRWLEPRVFIGNYPYTEDEDVAIYVDRKNQNNLSFKIIDKNDKKNI